MSVFEILLACLPFFIAAGFGVYMLLASFFPSWRERGWNHWKVFVNTDDDGGFIRSITNDLGFSKPAKPTAEGDWPEVKARRIYFWTGLALILVAFLGIRHFAGVPPFIPDLFGGMPG
jgi:hypothetical protein